jgi:CHAT domain-containing protein/Tfp pilus assembly protein PilF
MRSPGPFRRRSVAAAGLLLSAMLAAPAGYAQSGALQEAWRHAWGLIEAGRAAEGEPVARSAVDLARREAGELSPEFERSISILAYALQAEGRYKDAEALFRRALEIREQVLGRDDPRTAPAVYSLAVLLRWEGRFPEAEPLFRRALALWEKGPEGAALANGLNGLGNVLQDEGRYKEAEPLQRRALSIREKVLGPDAADVAESLFNLGDLLEAQGRFAEAEACLRRSAAIREKTFGPRHPAVAASLSDLGIVLERMGRYADAEAVLRRSLEIDESLNLRSRDVAASLNNMAVLYELEGRLDDAERAYYRALSIQESVLGPEHPNVSATLGNIVILLEREGRYDEAEPIARRALDVDQRALGPNHPQTAVSVDNLAEVLEKQGELKEAEALMRRGLEIREKALGPEHMAVSVSLQGLARLLMKEGHFNDAEPLFQRVIEIRTKIVGANANDTATAVQDLAETYALEGRFGDAEGLYRRALAVKEKAIGQGNADVATALFDLAAVLTREDRDPEARTDMQRATAILAAQPFWGSDKATRARVREARPFYFGYAALASRLIKTGQPDSRELGDEAFAALQWMKASDTAAAVSHMAARFDARSDALASLLRKQQDAQAKLAAMRAAVLRSEGMGAERNEQAEAVLQAEVDALGQELQRLDAEVAAKFPAYAELANPRPISIAGAQRLLAPDEALIVAVSDKSGAVVSVATRTRATLRRVDLGAEALAALVKRLRGGLAAAGPVISAFPASAAYELYERLLAPVEDEFRQAKQIIFVGDGPLESLPLSVLLTDRPPVDATRDPAALRRLAWFSRRYAVTVLPSVSALKALREAAGPSKAPQPFLGVGDPLLKHHPPSGGGLEVAAVPRTRSAFRGDAADVNYLRSLPSLPETAVELEADARMLGAGPDSLLLRERATVTAVTHADLAGRRVVAFATHALLADDGDTAEPGLVLTPPAAPSAADDVLLRASVIATLKLDADLVVLSACNTAASDGTPGAEGFSGLTKAFLYAGARALVVSHWSVESDATVDLMGRFFAASAEPSVGRAEAMRRAMLGVLDDKDHREFAHPFYWAPFVVVGEGDRPAALAAAHPQ